MADDAGTSGEAIPQWDGCVLEVNGDIFTAELCREGAPDLLVNFSMAQCGVTVERGDRLIVRSESVIKRDLGVWTQAELDAIMHRAREQSRRLRQVAD